MENCYENFLAAIKTEATKINYTRALEKFREFSGVKEFSEFKKMSYEEVKDLLAKYVQSINHLTYPSCNSYLSAIELFLDMNEILYPKKIIRRMLPANDKKAGGNKPYTTQEIQKMLKSTTNLKTKFLIHLFVSTGGRPNALHDPILTLGDVEDMPNGCKAVLVYEGSKEEYWTFWTPECVEAFNDYISARKRNGEYLTNDSPLFISKGRPIPYRAVRKLMETVVENSGIVRTKVGHRYDKALFYGFRKRFNTILKIDNDVNSNIAEKLMAHKRGLDGVYLQPTREECFEEFKKAILELAIDPTERQRIELQKKQEEISELQQSKITISEMDERYNKMSEMYKKFTSMKAEIDQYEETKKILLNKNLN